MSCDMSCEEETSSRPDGAGGVAMALRALESPDWPQLTLAVLGRNGTRREVVQRLAAMLDQRAGRDGREKPDGDADTGKRGLTEREREILDMWPKFDDGAYVWFGDGVRTHNGIAITVEAIEFSLGKFCVKDGEDGDWDTSMYAMHPLKRPAPKVLDADGVEVHVGDTVFELETGEEYKVERVFSGATDPDFPDHTIRCNKVADLITHVFKPDQLIHTRPDSWERLEEDAVKGVCAYFGFLNKCCDDGDGCPANKPGDCAKFKVLDTIRRAKKLAGVEADG